MPFTLAVLARIAEEADLDDGVRVAGELAPVPSGSGRLVTTALADALRALLPRREARTFSAESPG